MQNKENVKRHFNRAVESYDEYANVQKTMANELSNLILNKINKISQIIEIGCGTGYFTEKLVNCYPKAKIIVTDIASSMIEKTKIRLCDYKDIEYICHDGEDALKRKYDLIASNAVFQWFNKPRIAFENFEKALNDKGYLAFATFGTKTFNELIDSFTRAYKVNGILEKYQHGPKFLAISQLREMLNKFEVTFFEREYKEYFPTVRQFLQSIKKVGAQNSSDAKNVIKSKNILKSMMDYYKDKYQTEKGISATYHVIYAIARKKD